MADRAASLADALTERVQPRVLAHERVLELVDPLAPLFPHAGLRRGSTVAVGGGAGLSLALALAAGPSATGAWVAVIGVPGLGLGAAAEAGIALERLFLVAEPPSRHWAEVVAAAADGAEVVITRVPDSVRAAEIRRVQSRLQARGAVLLGLGAAGPLGAELDCRAEPLGWEGIGEGHGRLVARRVEVEVGGRRAGRPRRGRFWLPGPDGRIAELAAEPTSLAPRRIERQAG